MPRIVVTPGEPAGIGPDVVLKLAQQSLDCELVVAADAGLLEQRATQLRLPIRIQNFDSSEPLSNHIQGSLTVLHCPLASAVEVGNLNPDNASYVLDTLNRAADGCISGEFDAMVTGPVQKSVINEAGIPFSGHTEYLADRSNTEKVVMMLATDPIEGNALRVALVTTHIPLSAVPAAVTADNLEQTLRILDQDLKSKFGFAKPTILVCGLNPHAGESGHLGREEIETIEPTIATLEAAGMQLVGPVPADTAFTPRSLKDVDAVLAMYHDQGLPVLKSLGFGEAVNVTLGLPFIRTSVDHGTALDLAGTGKANESSLAAAIELAIKLAS